MKMDAPQKTAFASASLTEHVLRGAFGIGAISLAINLGEPGGAWWTLPAALTLGLLSILAFRGCPICWTIGLAETLWRHLRK
jgi:hypothetical protein